VLTNLAKRFLFFNKVINNLPSYRECCQAKSGAVLAPPCQASSMFTSLRMLHLRVGLRIMIKTAPVKTMQPVNKVPASLPK